MHEKGGIWPFTATSEDNTEGACYMVLLSTQVIID
jgi:hypothetical protein